MSLLRLCLSLVLTLGLVLRAAELTIPNQPYGGWVAGATGTEGNVGIPYGLDRFLPGGADDRTTIINVTQAPYNVDNTGVADASAIVQQVVLDYLGQSVVIYLPAGTYRWDAVVTLNKDSSNTTVRGAGNSTIINLGSTARFINVVEANAYAWDQPSSGSTIAAGHASLNAGSTSLTIADTSTFSANDLIRIILENDDAIPILGVGGTPVRDVVGVRNQMAMVTAVPNSTTLTISPGLYGDYRATGARVARTSRVCRYIGIEDFYVNCENSSAQGIMDMTQAYACWVKGVYLYKQSQFGMGTGDCVRPEFRLNNVRSIRNKFAGSSGMVLGSTSGALMEDNIFYDCFPALEIVTGTCGSVVAYNFFHITNSGGVMGASVNMNHGPSNHYNLVEGNISQKVQSDGYYGSDTYNTIYRNWLHATCIDDRDPTLTTNQFGIAINLNRFSRYFNIVGNILGSPSPGSGVTQLYTNVGPWRGADSTSSTSVTIGIGTKVFTTPGGLPWLGSFSIKIHSAADPTNFMSGIVDTYSGTTLTMTIDKTGGSGTFSDWVIRCPYGLSYNERYMMTFGLPNLGSGGFSGIAEHSRGASATWAAWAVKELAGTSATSMTVSTGSKTFTTEAGLTAPNGTIVDIVYAYATYLRGEVTAYSGTSMTVNVTDVQGSGTHADWVIHGFTNANSWPEFDYDVVNTAFVKGNYNFATTSIGPGVVAGTDESLGGDTLRNSLFRSSAPAYFSGFTWPPFDASSPGTPSYSQIPAGARYMAEGGGAAPAYNPARLGPMGARRR